MFVGHSEVFFIWVWVCLCFAGGEGQQMNAVWTLKVLMETSCLLPGPYHLNGCPLRRINQAYVIATKTKLDLKGVKLPERLNDEYFRRQKLRKPKHTEGEIFDTKKEVILMWLA